MKHFEELTERKTTHNSTYPKGGVSCSKDSFVIIQTLVFQIKFCGKNPALRVAAKRYRQFMKLKLIIIQFFLLINLCKGQSDTTKYPDFSKYNSLRYELGYQTSPFIGLGYSHFTVDNRPFHFGSYGYYVSLEYDFSKLVTENKNYYGLKVGWEASGWFLMYALELKYLNNSTNSQVVFTPKFGLSLCGFINILYGYNLPDKLRLEGISNNQISIIANINRKIIKDL